MRPFLACTYAFVGVLLLALPNMTRRGILFGRSLPPDFRTGDIGRTSIASFRTLVAVATVAGLSLLWLAPDTWLAWVAIVEPLVLLATGAAGFALQYVRLRPFVVEPTPTLETELGTGPDKLPGFAWLAAGPFAAMGMAAIFLSLNWDRIPERFPVHWGADGQVNRWSMRTPHDVYGPLIFAALLSGWLLVMALANWYGARRSRFRRVMLGALIGMVYLMGFLFAGIALNPVINVPIWIFVVAPLVFLVPFILVLMRSVAEPGERAAEPTPNECWKGGAIYYNPNDAALMVEKRTGLGYTMNYGNGWSWVLMAGLGLVVASAFVLL